MAGVRGKDKRWGMEFLLGDVLIDRKVAVGEVEEKKK